MDYSNLSLFSVTQAKMRYLSAREGVLAQNVANADTPGYQAQDLKKPDFSKIMAGKMSANVQFKQVARDHTGETHLNGNNVSLDQEMKDISLTSSDYGDAVTLYHKTVAMFQTAIGVGGGTTA